MINFIKELFFKSNHYVLVWMFILSKISQDNENQNISVFEIMKKTKTKKSLFYVIIKFGIDFLQNKNDIFSGEIILKNNYIHIIKNQENVDFLKRKKRSKSKSIKTIPKIKIKTNNVSENIDVIQSVIEYLNISTSSKYDYQVSNTIKLLDNLISQGYVFEDFKNVIDLKNHQWTNTQLEKNLKPSTLFEESKFEAYINELEIPKKKKNQKPQIQQNYEAATQAKEFIANRDQQ